MLGRHRVGPAAGLLGLVAAIATAFPAPTATAQPLDLNKLRGVSEVPPVEVQVIDPAAGPVTFELAGNLLFAFDVDDPRTLYRIQLTSTERVSLVVEAMKLELNEASQPTSRTTLQEAVTSNRDRRPARLPDLLFRPGRVHLGVAAMRPVTAELSVEALPMAETPADLPARVTEAIPVGNDVAGLWNGDEKCVRPALMQSGQAVDVELLRPPGLGAVLSLYDRNGRRVAERSGAGELVVRNVRDDGLTACIELSGRGDDQTGWRLTVDPSNYPDGPPEPDDGSSDGTATLLRPGQPVTAILDVDDLDRYDVAASPDSKLVTVNMQSLLSSEVCLLEDDGDSECWRGREFDIGPFVAERSSLHIENRGDRSGPYRLTAKAADVDAARTVPEPNGETGQQALVPPGSRITGTLSMAGDEDVIGFDAGSRAQLWRIVVLGDTVRRVYVYNDRGVVADLRRANDGRRLTTPDLYLDPGGAFLRLSGSPGPYKVILKPLGEPRPNDEREPNEDLPRRLTLGEPVVGTLPQNDDDVFSFFLDRDGPVRFALDVPAGGRFQLESSGPGGEPSTPDFERVSVSAGGWSRQAEFPAGEHILDLKPREASPAEYRLLATHANPFDTEEPATLALTAPAPTPVRAFSTFRQQVDIPVTLTHPGPGTIRGQLRSWFARHGVEQAPTEFVLAGNGTTTVTLPVTLPQDLYTGELVGFLAAVDSADRILGSVRVTIPARPDQPPARRLPALPAPAELIGGINVAQTALGARWRDSGPHRVDPSTGDYAEDNPARAANLPKIIDGFPVQEGRGAYKHAGYLARDGRDALAPVLELPGDRPLPIVGVGVDTRMQRSIGLRRFAVDASADGSSWTEVLQATHDTWGRTAYYRFPGGVVPARLIRLRALDRRNDDVALTGFEVIAEPGALGAEDLNIADRRVGALVTGWQDVRGGLTTQIDPERVIAQRFEATGEQTDFNLAITFRNQMRAEIDAVELVYPPAAPDDDHPWANGAVMSISPRGPSGPWREVARFDLPDDPQPGQVVRHELPEWVGARAVKIDYRLTEPGRFYAPGLIRVLERPDDDVYRSVLGLWGEYASQRVEVEPKRVSEPEDTVPDTKPRLIDADGLRHSGLVEFSRREETWRVSVGPDENVIRLFVAGSPGFEPAVLARDPSGQPVEPLAVVREPFQDDTRYEFPVGTARQLDITIAEEARSTVFLFDQSPSVARYIPVIRRAIVDFAEAMVAGRDAVRFKSLGGDWTGEAWYTDPNNLRRALATYRGDDSSAAEPALIDAAAVLRERDGSRAIVVITDGDGKPQPSLPFALDQANARVFVIKISSGGGTFSDPTLSQPLVMSWAGQTGGQVDPVLKSEDVAVGYARASARLLGPKAYSLRAVGDYRPLEPGFLAVSGAASEAADVTADGMLIIADASGSMLKRLEDGRRITIARRALKTFVEDMADDAGKVPMGLRVFGGEPHSCSTALLRPVGDHPVQSLLADVDALQPRNNARTAIGDALEAAVQDLRNVAGAKSVLLVTDGEETCDGDPMRAVQKLREAFPDTRVDVVTFALEDEIDRRPFQRWAAAGGGIHVDAADGSTLAAALRAAARVRFDVLRGDEIVASGAVGGAPVALEPGSYELDIDGTRRDLRVDSGQTTQIEWSSPP